MQLMIPTLLTSMVLIGSVAPSLAPAERNAPAAKKAESADRISRARAALPRGWVWRVETQTFDKMYGQGRSGEDALSSMWRNGR